MEKLYPNPRKGNGESVVWDHFGFKCVDSTKLPKENNLDMQFVYRNYCKKQYKNHSNMKTSCHSVYYATMCSCSSIWVPLLKKGQILL